MLIIPKTPIKLRYIALLKDFVARNNRQPDASERTDCFIKAHKKDF
jgi:hypothetical protein